MAENKPNRKPAFFWQGVLILLPVGVLSLICLFSLRQDKSFAAEDARNLGGAVAAQIAGTIGREAAYQLTNYFIAVDIQPWRYWDPLDSTNFEQEIRLEAIAEKWQKAHSATDLSTVPYVTFTLGNSKSVTKYRLLSSDSDVYTPSPPDWLQHLSVEQIQIWNEERRAEASGDAEAARLDIEKFMATNPSQGARANAELHQLLLKTRNMGASEAEKALMFSSLFGSGEFTDAGLPIAYLVFYRALRLLPDHAGVPEYLYMHIGVTTSVLPSILCEPLVEETIRAVGARTEYSQRVGALQWCLRSHKKACGSRRHVGSQWCGG